MKNLSMVPGYSMCIINTGDDQEHILGFHYVPHTVLGIL